MIKRKDYPKELHIGDEVYRVRFTRKMEDPTHLGECDPSSKEIRILPGQSREDTLKTFIHEVCHALLQFENNTGVEHKTIYKLEEPIYRFFLDNFL